MYVTTEHREEVGTRDKAQTIALISRGHQGTVEYQAREFHWERSQSFARIRVAGTVEMRASRKSVKRASLRGKIGLSVFDHMLKVLPLHLKGLLQGKHRQPEGIAWQLGLAGECPITNAEGNFREKPGVKLVGFTNETLKIMVSSIHFQPRRKPGQPTDKGKKQQEQQTIFPSIQRSVE